MFVRDRDFRCETSEDGIVRCTPMQDGATQTYKMLQVVLAKLLPQVPDAPPLSVEPDGTIGPTTVFAVQIVATRLATTPHQELAPLATMQPEEAIPLVAERASDVAGYLAGLDPAVLATAPALGEPPPLPKSESPFTISRVAMASAALLGLVGIGLFARASSLRGAGTVDRSDLLPLSDGSDQFDDEGHGEDVEAASA